MYPLSQSEGINAVIHAFPADATRLRESAGPFKDLMLSFHFSVLVSCDYITSALPCPSFSSFSSL